MHRTGLVVWVSLACMSLAVVSLAGMVTRVSVNELGNEGFGPSGTGAPSADGRFVAFASEVSSFVAGDTNGVSDIFVRDRQTGTVERVSVDGSGGQSDGASTECAISDDGRFVAFVSTATNLVAGDTNGTADVFVHDRQTGATERVSIGPGGVESNGDSGRCDISAGGGHVAFDSVATNLVAGDTNGNRDVFVHDRGTHSTVRASVSTAGLEGDGTSEYPCLDSSGGLVAFQSTSTNLVAGDTNGVCDVFVRDATGPSTTRVSVTRWGAQADDASDLPAISGDGRYVAFASLATNFLPAHNGIPQLYRKDRVDGGLAWVTVGANGQCGRPSVSADGSRVAFATIASNLVPYDDNGLWDVYLRDMQTRVVSGLTAGYPSTAGNGDSTAPHISADGKVVGFASTADNLIADDTNSSSDAFVSDSPRWQADGTIRVGGQWIGGNIYNHDGTGQTAGQSAHRGQAVRYLVRVWNDSAAYERLRVTATGSSSTLTVSYLLLAWKRDVTSELTGGGLTLPWISSRSYYTFQVTVWPGPSAMAGTGVPVYVTAAPLTDPTASDTVCALTTCLADYQPDGVIHNGNSYIGGNIYHTYRFSGQTHEVEAGPPGTTHYLGFQNDGNDPDTFVVSGPAGTPQWSVQYLEYWTGQDITSQVTGAGWQPPQLAAGQYCRMKVLVAPAAAVRGGTRHECVVTAVSSADGSKWDAVRAVTRCAAGYGVDAMISDGTTYLGDNLYNRTGVGQERAANARPAAPARYYVALENEGNSSDTLRVTGTASNALWTVTYQDYWTGADVTTQVAKAGWNVQNLPRWGVRRLLVQVTPRPGTVEGSQLVVLVSVTSQGDTTKRDAVRMTTTNVPSVRPDCQIYDGATLVGDGIYNRNGAGQSRTLTVPAGGTVTFYPRIENDGDAPDRFTITGTVRGGWTVRYFDYWTGNDITAGVLGAGWQTSTVQPGDSVRLRVLVTADPGNRSGSTLQSLLQAASIADATRTDAVKLITTVP